VSQDIKEMANGLAVPSRILEREAVTDLHAQIQIWDVIDPARW